MKLTTFFILISTFTLIASVSFSQNKTVTINRENTLIKDVLQEIEDQSGYFFIYNNEFVDVYRKVNIHAREKSVADVLDIIFREQDITYTINDRRIILSSSGKQLATSQQQRSVSGKVTDSFGNPLPGVTVMIKGMSNGTITSAKGNYVLKNVPANAVLSFSFVGMRSEEIAVGDQSSVDIAMEEEAIGIGEVVAIGYGTKQKGELTGSVSEVDDQVFESRPITNTLNALQGAMPGVLVTRGSGQPGREGYSLNIRGVSSIAGSEPLILIDGIPGDLNTINPNDIQNVTVLKDAAASIYGARAADGVLLVTTKSGKRGELVVSYSFNYGIKTPTYMNQMTNTLEMAEMYDEGMRNIGQPGVTQDVFEKIRMNASPEMDGGWMKYLENYPGFYGSHNWFKDIFGTGNQQSHNVTVSGGGDNTNYLFSVGYKNDKGGLNYGTAKSDLYNLRFNFGFKLFKNRLKIDTRTAFDDQIIAEPSALNEAFLHARLAWSYVPIYTPEEKFYWYQNYTNPAQLLVENGKKKSDYKKFKTNIKGDLKIFDGLKLVGQVGINLDVDDANSNIRTFDLIDWMGNSFASRNNPSSATFSNSKNTYGSYTGYLEYNRNFHDNHQINLMAGGSHEQNEYQSQSITGYNFKSNDLFTLNLADKTNTAFMNYTGSLSDWALNSFFGRASYSFKRKINLDFTTRLDGSSKFAPEKRWSALFPSVSASWNSSEEDFIRALDFFDILKLRGSWGKAGNQNLSFGNYDYIPLISISGTYPLGSPNVGLPGATASIASESRTWETIETVNLGIDFAFFESKLNGSFDYFIKQNNDMLVSVTLPATLGGTAPTLNIGKLKTKGWDLMVSWSDKKGDFKYSVSAMVSDANNKLIKLEGNDNYGEGLIYTREGYPLNSYFGYISDGIIKNEQELTEYKKLGNIPANIGIGDAKYKDVDGDGRITAFGNPAQGTKGDMKYLGDRNPRYTYSSDIKVSYKNFELSALLQGVGKRVGVRTGIPSMPLYFVWHQSIKWFYEKTWTPERPDAEYPRIIPGGVGWDNLRDWNYRYSDRVINKLSYMRVKSLILSYNMPQSLCSDLKMQSLRIYASGEDLFTFSKGTWGNSYDPEENNSGFSNYPIMKTLSFGVEVVF